MNPEEYADYILARYPVYLRFVRRLVRNEADAEDVLQETIVKLLPRCPTLDPTRLDALLLTALRRKVIDCWRREARQPHGQPLRDDPPERGYTPPEVVDADLVNKCAALVREAKACLTPYEQKVFAAYWKADGNRSRAMTDLALSAGRYDMTLHHARNKLIAAFVSDRETLKSLEPSQLWQLIADAF